MIEEINKIKRKLENLLITHNLDDEEVLETSCELDELIVEYYKNNKGNNYNNDYIIL